MAVFREYASKKGVKSRRLPHWRTTKTAILAILQRTQPGRILRIAPTVRYL